MSATSTTTRLSMQALVLDGPRAVSTRALAVPEPGPGQLRVALEGSGICGSDVPVWQGRDWFAYPREPGAPGHEGWGRVDAIGDGVDGFVIGDRVSGLMYHAYAEQDLLDAAVAVKLPPALDGIPFPAEPLGCAVNVFRRSAIGAGDRVAVVGVGFLGALVLQLAADAGAEVIAIGRRDSALACAAELGAAHVVVADTEAVDHVREITDEQMCDVVIEAAGTQATLDLAGRLLRDRGRLVIAGFHQDGPRQVDLQSWNWQGLDVINAHERDPAVYLEGIRMAIDLQLAGRLTPERLYSHEFALADFAKAMRVLEERPAGFMKALIHP